MSELENEDPQELDMSMPIGEFFNNIIDKLRSVDNPEDYGVTALVPDRNDNMVAITFFFENDQIEVGKVTTPTTSNGTLH